MTSRALATSHSINGGRPTPLKQSAGVTESRLESFLFRMSVQLLVPNGSLFILRDKQRSPLLEMVCSQGCHVFHTLSCVLLSFPSVLDLGVQTAPGQGIGGGRASNMPESCSMINLMYTLTPECKISGQVMVRLGRQWGTQGLDLTLQRDYCFTSGVQVHRDPALGKRLAFTPESMLKSPEAYAIMQIAVEPGEWTIRARETAQ